MPQEITARKSWRRTTPIGDLPRQLGRVCPSARRRSRPPGRPVGRTSVLRAAWPHGGRRVPPI